VTRKCECNEEDWSVLIVSREQRSIDECTVSKSELEPRAQTCLPCSPPYERFDYASTVR